MHNIGDVTMKMMTSYFSDITESLFSGGGHVTCVHFCRDDDYAVLKLPEQASKLHYSQRVEHVMI